MTDQDEFNGPPGEYDPTNEFDCACVPLATVEGVDAEWLQPGDVLFFHSRSSVDGLIRGFNLGDYCHVGVMVNFDERFIGGHGYKETLAATRKMTDGSWAEMRKIPVLVHVEHGFEITLPSKLFETRADANDLHIDIRRPFRKVNQRRLTEAAIKMKSAKYAYRKLITAGSEIARAYSDERGSIFAHLDVNAALFDYARKQKIDLDAITLRTMHALLEAPKDLFRKQTKLVCANFVTKTFLDGNETALGTFPEDIGIPQDAVDENGCSLLQKYGEDARDWEKNVQAGHDPVFDQTELALPPIHELTNFPSRIAQLARIRSESAKMVPRMSFTDYCKKYPIVGPNNLLDGDGFIRTTYRLRRSQVQY